MKDPSQLPGKQGFLPDNVAAGKAIYGVECKGRASTFCPIATLILAGRFDPITP
jgi:hypothetical protein